MAGGQGVKKKQSEREQGVLRNKVSGRSRGSKFANLPQPCQPPLSPIYRPQPYLSVASFANLSASALSSIDLSLVSRLFHQSIGLSLISRLFRQSIGLGLIIYRPQSCQSSLSPKTTPGGENDGFNCMILIGSWWTEYVLVQSKSLYHPRRLLF